MADDIDEFAHVVSSLAALADRPSRGRGSELSPGADASGASIPAVSGAAAPESCGGPCATTAAHSVVDQASAFDLSIVPGHIAVTVRKGRTTFDVTDARGTRAAAIHLGEADEVLMNVFRALLRDYPAYPWSFQVAR